MSVTFPDVTVMRNMAMIQVLDYGERVSQEKDGRRTNKKPRPKIPATAILCFKGSSSLQIIGSGSIKMMKSDTIFAELFMFRITDIGWQVPGMLLSHDFATGLQAKSWMNTWPTCHAAMIDISTI